MTKVKKVGYLYSEQYLLHSSPKPHIENPERVEVINKVVNRNLSIDLEAIRALRANENSLTLVHPQSYIDKIKRVAKKASQGIIYLDDETYVNEHTFENILYVIGGIEKAADFLFEGGKYCFCNIRPPGHHASHDVAGGFCLVNNAVYAAKYGIKTYGLDRVLIIDWDAHDGDGTRRLVKENRNIHLINIYQSNIFPREKHIRKIGNITNHPLNPGSGDKEFRDLFNSSVKDVIKQYKPEVIVLSAGFDAHIDDDISDLGVTTKMYGELTRLVIKYAGDAPIISLLEGGYKVDVLADSVVRHLKAFINA